eukprot:4661249-Pleurochrysis_carterae.AAC.2
MRVGARVSPARLRTNRLKSSESVSSSLSMPRSAPSCSSTMLHTVPAETQGESRRTLEGGAYR